MMKTGLLQQLIEAFTIFPGVGQKTAQRFVYYLLGQQQDAARRLVDLLDAALKTITQCQACRMFSDTPLCPICCDRGRHKDVLCVVESPSALMAIERSTDFSGVYFVLHGCLSPLDGIGPEDIGLDCLKQQVQENAVKEIVLAVGATVEGDVTAHVIHELLASSTTRITRLAQGVPTGGELEYIDSTTLSRAFEKRQEYVV